MKKLKFLALGLVAAFGFAACGSEDPEDQQTKENTYKQSTVVMGGAASANGSFYTIDGVKNKAGVAENGEIVVFCFQTLDDNYRFISGTEATNEIVKAKASKTLFVQIGDATGKKFEKVDWKDGKTTIDITKKMDDGKKAVAFKNEKLEGFFEIVSYEPTTEDLTLNVWIKE